MFDETLDVYPHKKVHFDIDPNAKSVHPMPYSVPQIHLKTFKKEFNHLIGLGVVVPMEITFMDNGGNIFVLDEFMWNPYRFLISSLGLPTFFLRIAKRER